jgi:hypothetical protein
MPCEYGRGQYRNELGVFKDLEEGLYERRVVIEGHRAWMEEQGGPFNP